MSDFEFDGLDATNQMLDAEWTVESNNTVQRVFQACVQLRSLLADVAMHDIQASYEKPSTEKDTAGGQKISAEFTDHPNERRTLFIASIEDRLTIREALVNVLEAVKANKERLIQMEQRIATRSHEPDEGATHIVQLDPSLTIFGQDVELAMTETIQEHVAEIFSKELEGTTMLKHDEEPESMTIQLFNYQRKITDDEILTIGYGAPVLEPETIRTLQVHLQEQFGCLGKTMERFVVPMIITNGGVHQLYVEIYGRVPNV